MNPLSICDFEGCNLYLENPVSFPCGHTVCKNHIQDDDLVFSCLQCNKSYPIPIEGFRINFKLFELISLNSHLTGKHKQVKEMYDKLKSTISNYKISDLAYPDKFLHDYFSNLRNSVDLHREQMIEDINKRSDEILSSLNETEKKYTENLNLVMKLNINDFENSEWHDMLRNPHLENEKINDIQNQIQSCLDNFKNSVISYQNNLLMNEKIMFKKLNNRTFGYLKTTANKIIYESLGYYEGELLMDAIKHGYGTFYFNDGEKYVGDWKNDKYDGNGTYYFNTSNDVDEEKFEGHWKNGKRNGQGTSYFRNGDRLEANFRNNEKDGEAKLIRKNGKTIIQLYSNGKLLE